MTKLNTKLLAIITLSLTITACGGGGGGGGAPAATETSSGAASQSTSSNTGSNTAPGSTSNETARENNTPPPGSTITISWSQPTTRANGDLLNPGDIGGYQVYYYLQGTAEGSGTAVDIPGENTLSYTTPTLSVGTYFFSIATYDKNNVYGQMSDPVQATVN